MRKRPKVGCPCGCNPGETCMARSVRIGAGYCQCSSLGIERLSKGIGCPVHTRRNISA